jgi:hypothetical protein
MALSLSQKLRIKEGMKLVVLHPPEQFKSRLLPLPENVRIALKGDKFDQLHWFVKDQAQLGEEMEEVIGKLRPGVICWIYYPKGSSGIKTDLTRDKGWENLLKHTELQWLSLISFDGTWSAFGMRLTAPGEVKKERPREERIIFNYADPIKKTVHLPDDLGIPLRKNKKALAFFESLSFTNKKEYVEWVVTAKREETRKERVSGTLERLVKGWKNPRNS